MSTTTPYEAIGGEQTVRDIARRFYFLLDNDPDYAELRALHAPDLAPIQQSLGDFLIGWLGGPRDWFDKGRGCIFSLHAGIAIPDAVAGQWADAMRRAIIADPRIDPAFGEKMGDTLAQMAQGMVNVRAEESPTLQRAGSG